MARSEGEVEGAGEVERAEGVTPTASAEEKGMAEEALVRKTSRVLLIDATGRTLLFRSLSETTGESFWYPPGGGVEGGEDYEEAARREIFEETGIAELVNLTTFGSRRSSFIFNKVPTIFEEIWFYATVPTQDIDVTGFTEFEKSNVIESKWWTLEEMLKGVGRLVPTNLPDLLGEYLSSGQLEGFRELPI